MFVDKLRLATKSPVCDLDVGRSPTLFSPTWRTSWTDVRLLKVLRFAIATLTAAPHRAPRSSKTKLLIITTKWLTHGFLGDTSYPLKTHRLTYMSWGQRQLPLDDLWFLKHWPHLVTLFSLMLMCTLAIGFAKRCCTHNLRKLGH